MLDGCRQAEGEEEAGNIDAFLFSLLFASPPSRLHSFRFSFPPAPPPLRAVVLLFGHGCVGKRKAEKRGMGEKGIFFLSRTRFDED